MDSSTPYLVDYPVENGYFFFLVSDIDIFAFGVYIHILVNENKNTAYASKPAIHRRAPIPPCLIN